MHHTNLNMFTPPTHTCSLPPPHPTPTPNECTGMDGYRLDGKALTVRLAGQKDPPRRTGLGFTEGGGGGHSHGHGHPPAPPGVPPPMPPGVSRERETVALEREEWGLGWKVVLNSEGSESCTMPHCVSLCVLCCDECCAAGLTLPHPCALSSSSLAAVTAAAAAGNAAGSYPGAPPPYGPPPPGAYPYQPGPPPPYGTTCWSHCRHCKHDGWLVDV